MAKGSGPTEVEGSGTGGGGGAITAPFGRKADAASVSVALSTEDVALLNPLTATVSGTVTATGILAAAPVTGVIYAPDGTTTYTPKFAKITASASGATQVVAAVTAKKIRVIAWDVVCNAAVNVKWQSHVTPTDETGLYYFAANGGIEKSFNPAGYFETVAGEALDINLSGAQAVGGSLVYIEV